MANVGATVEGTERFIAKLRQMRSIINSAESKQIGMAGAAVIVRAAKGIVHVQTGHLRDSIHAEETEEAGVAQAVAGGEGVDYAGDEEYGNSRRPPHPYMRPAVDESKSEVRTVMRRRSYALIKKATS